MSWVVQSASEGPVILSDIGMTFTKGQIRDLDIIGRENADRSNDIKLALAKGWIRELKKDAHSGAGALDPRLLEGLKETATKANDAVAKMEQAASEQRQTIQKLEEELRAQKEQNTSNTERLMAKMQEMIDHNPLHIKAIKETLENIQSERGAISRKREEMIEPGHSEAEIKANEKILQMRDKKLQKNYEELGKTITQAPNDIQDALDALDKLGI